MSQAPRSRACRILALVLLPLGAMPLTAVGAGAVKREGKEAAGEKVELFEAMKAGNVHVKIILKNEFEARVQITNKTKKPLNVNLPEAFAATPVLAQRQTTSSNNTGNQNQGTGGGFGGGGGGGGFGGGGGGGQGGGFFNVPAEKIGHLKVAMVCLEHGKKVPRPGIAYEIKPIESFTSKAELQELCKMVGYRHYSSQRAAQAAAWHLANNLSWQQLAAKQIEHLNAPSEPYFSPQELREAVQISIAAETEAQKRPSESASESSRKASK